MTGKSRRPRGRGHGAWRVANGSGPDPARERRCGTGGAGTDGVDGPKRARCRGALPHPVGCYQAMDFPGVPSAEQGAALPWRDDAPTRVGACAEAGAPGPGDGDGRRGRKGGRAGNVQCGIAQHRTADPCRMPRRRVVWRRDRDARTRHGRLSRARGAGGLFCEGNDGINGDPAAACCGEERVRMGAAGGRAGGLVCVSEAATPPRPICAERGKQPGCGAACHVDAAAGGAFWRRRRRRRRRGILFGEGRCCSKGTVWGRDGGGKEAAWTRAGRGGAAADDANAAASASTAAACGSTALRE
eukprot:352485-Chlamydomonas_euryale.AAC.2